MITRAIAVMWILAQIGCGQGPDHDPDAGDTSRDVGLGEYCTATTRCVVPHGFAACVNSECLRASCADGHAACGFDYGCSTDLTSDRTNCGTCGTTCPQLCVASHCVTVDR